MRKLHPGMLCLVPCLWLLSGSQVAAQVVQEEVSVDTRITGFEEVTPKLSPGSGRLRLVISADRSTIAYQLTYTQLSSAVNAAHLHFGQRGVNGGIFTFLCGGGGKPECPAAGGTVSGNIAGGDIMEVADQNVPAGNLAAAIRIILNGTSYVNVHTTNFPGGEIRGQLEPSFDFQ